MIDRWIRLPSNLVVTGNRDTAERPLVLVVDDDAFPRLLAREALERAGFAVAEASDGRGGVEAFERLRPALVLMDAVMPEMDGFAACAAIRALPAGLRVPILVMTGLDDVEAVRRAFEAGATDFASKPLHGPILAVRVAHLVQTARAREGEPGTVPGPLSDPETGLPSRHRFVERVEEELARVRRYRERFAVAIVRFDLFREFVNEYGDAVGNRVLRTFASVLAGSLRETDMVARITPNEFGLLLTKLESKYSTTMVVRRILDLLAQGIAVDGKTHHFTACAGISLAGVADDETVSSLLKQGDVALSRARRMGRNQVQLYSPEMSASVTRRIGMEAVLAEALEKRRFVVHYQPAVDLGTGAIVGAEALVRLVHPERGIVPPGEFIPIAEETGIIVSITEQVARDAFREARTWQLPGAPPVGVAVNVSGRDFQDAGLARKIAGLVREAGIDPGLVEIEITESVAMHDFATTLHVLHGLRDLGARVAIDDFGTGHSSLAYLKRFPIQRLKIDRAFIQDMMENAEDRAIVNAIIGMAHAMNMEVLAEGVERPEQAQYLVSRRCDRAQGWQFGKPVPAADFQAMLARQRARTGPIASA